MREDIDRYTKANVQILAIGHQGGRPVQRWLEKNPLPFPWLYDTDREVIKAYGIYNAISYDALRMAHPAAVLIDEDGLVRFVYRSSTQWDIPKRNMMLAALKSLRT